MEINIPTTKDKIFKQYLTILNSILSNRKLTSTEIEVVGKLLYIDNMYSHIPKDKRDKILFHKQTKEKIRESLQNMSKFSYGNVLTSLRKKKIITKKELLIKAPLQNNEITITFKLKIQ